MREDVLESPFCDHVEGIAKARATRQLCLAMIAGGDSPERAAERLGLNIRLVDLIISLNMVKRIRSRLK
jgi:hypothetical protein